jgi:hypothetical protein
MSLTPVELAIDPIRVAVGTDRYNFSTQRREGTSPQLATTFNATQTFNGSGKPVDRDND